MADVATIIQQARWEDPSFTEERHSGAFLRATLADYDNELVGKIADVAGEELAIPYVQTLPLAVFADGFALEDPIESGLPPLRYKKILDWGEVFGSGNNAQTGRLRVIGPGQRFNVHRFPSVWFRSNRGYLVGDAGDWAAFASLTIQYVPMPPETLSSTDSPTLSDGDATGVYKAYLAQRMAKRAPKEIQRHPKELELEWVGMERQLIQDYMDRHVAMGYVEEVW